MNERSRVAIIAGTLAFASAASVFTQFVLGALAPQLRVEFALTRTQLGLATTTVYVAAAIVSPFIGRAVDWFGGRAVLVSLFGTAAAAWALIAGAPTYAVVLAASAVAGVALAAANPAANQVVAWHVARGDQGVVMGIKQAGAPFAGVLAGGLLPVGANVLGWRTSLLVAAALAVASIAAVLRWIPRSPTPTGGEIGAPEPAGETQVVRWLARYAFFMGAGMSPTFAYSSLYAFEALHMPPGQASLTIGVIGFVGATVTVLVGRFSTRFQQTARALAGIALGAVGFTAVLAAAAHTHSALLWIGVAGFAATAIPWHVVGMFAIVRGVAFERAGRGSGLVLRAFYMGVIASPFVFGLLVDLTGTYASGWAWVAVAFLGAVAVGVRWEAAIRAQVGERRSD